MKLKQLILLPVILLLSSGLHTFSQGKVYYVGHSLINLNVPFQVWKIQDNASVTSDFAHHINIGTALKLNWNDTNRNSNPIWDPALGRNVDRGTNHLTELIKPYDYLVMTEAVPLRNYPVDTTVKYMKNFIDLAKTGNSNIKKFLYATWEGDVSNGSSWRNELDSLQPIWETIADQCATVTGGDSVYIVPGNIAMMQLYDELQAGPIGTYTSINQFFKPDGIHLEPEGNYLIACLMSAVVYHTNPIGQGIIKAGPYTSDSCIRDNVARLRIQEIAMEVACNYARTGYNGSYCNTASIYNNTLDDVQISFYPNPSNGIFTIKSNSIINQIKVIDLAGKEILVSNSKKFDLSNYPKGLYFVSVLTDKNGTITKKIIIQ